MYLVKYVNPNRRILEKMKSFLTWAIIIVLSFNVCFAESPDLPVDKTAITNSELYRGCYQVLIASDMAAHDPIVYVNNVLKLLDQNQQNNEPLSDAFMLGFYYKAWQMLIYLSSYQKLFDEKTIDKATDHAKFFFKQFLTYKVKLSMSEEDLLRMSGFRGDLSTFAKVKRKEIEEWKALVGESQYDNRYYYPKSDDSSYTEESTNIQSEMKRGSDQADRAFGRQICDPVLHAEYVFIVLDKNQRNNEPLSDAFMVGFYWEAWQRTGSFIEMSKDYNTFDEDHINKATDQAKFFFKQFLKYKDKSRVSEEDLVRTYGYSGPSAVYILAESLRSKIAEWKKLVGE